jgi:hypothetical protein
LGVVGDGEVVHCNGAKKQDGKKSSHGITLLSPYRTNKSAKIFHDFMDYSMFFRLLLCGYERNKRVFPADKVVIFFQLEKHHM